MLIRNAEVKGCRRDVRIEAGKIASIAPALSPLAAEVIVNAGGGALLPGLVDNHCHLMATAAALQSIPCGPPDVRDGPSLAEALLTTPGSGWLRGIGYHESVAGEIDRQWLDLHGPRRPVRIQHRSGRMWILNSAALDCLGDRAPADGRLLDRDDWLQARLRKQPLDLAEVGRRLAARGVTSITDATVRNGPEEYETLATAGLPQRLVVMGQMSLAGQRPLHRARVGAHKLHFHDHDLPPLEDVVRAVGVAHDDGRVVAAHCVTYAELAWTLSAIEEAGALAGDRIEHGALIDDHFAEWIARLGLTVVTQPHFLAERGDAYRLDVPSGDHPRLYRLGGLMRQGIPLAGGSDAPFGGLDPWLSVAAAVNRPHGFGNDEMLLPDAALAMWTGHPDDPGGASRMVEEGEVADLCLLDRGWDKAGRDPAAVAVDLTVVGGEIVHQETAIAAQSNI
ncbi:metal-dependent hydrolase [Croceicoccus estronivorus]|uniref:amidohydrolase family protein n=1 Tax=Croceicoccus estronivorus TaxID=1172626 RepID=UPI00083709B3|nr:amidohydrolase family protein [Croceicoccus estronivorus]OCC23534.1 metal-dependent hydrolase [Croceicoccus estronivorus]